MPKARPDYSLTVFNDLLCEEDFSEVYQSELTDSELEDFASKIETDYDE